MVLTDYSELTLVGCFWRFGDWLITAKHVANSVSTGLADVYLAGVNEDSKGTSRLNKSAVRVDKGLFDIDSNLYDREIDVFVTRLDKKTWAKLGVKAASIKKDSLYNQTVSAVGFVNGNLVTSAGKTLVNSGSVELWHTATTNRGFSGSPLFSGNSVVGMHVAGSSTNNVAIRTEAIMARLRRLEETPDLVWDEVGQDWKFQGRSWDIEEFDEDFSLISSNGAVRHGFTREEIYDMFPDYGNRDSYDDAVDASWSKINFKSRKGKNWADYDDENAPVEQDYICKPPERPVHCNSSPSVQVEIEAYFSECSDELVSLGYDASKYIFPNIEPGLEERSVRKHLELFAHRNRNIVEPPTLKEKNRCIGLLLEMMIANSYEPNPDYKTTSNLISIIDSSLVKCSKSPGHPYQSEGMPTNANVLNKYTKAGVAQLVLDEWQQPFQLKCFLKAEPTKHKKIQNDMPRVITGLPLHKMIKHQAIFKEMLFNAVERWRDSPIKYPFSPSSPGHVEHLVRCFEGKKVYESDKTNWDFMFFGFVFDICKEVIKRLAVRPDSMSEEEFNEYLADVDGSFDEVINSSQYRCTNGKVFQPCYPGAMKSGWLLTIFCNSMAQVAVDTLIKMRLGLSDSQITSKDNLIIAGGDDVLQTFNGVDTEQYLLQAKLLGFELEEFIEHESFDGCEFFSHVFQYHEGIWKYKPVRFTKHIAKLATTKMDDLACALGSHMINYCWDRKRYSFFDKMFRHFRKQYPDKFPITYLKSMNYWRFKVKGYEANC